jgi:hypothetical protein
MKKEEKTEPEISRLAWADDMSKEEMQRFVKKEKEKLQNLSEIGISLTTYNDIFSSFDPRPYNQKALSDDFLEEARKASEVKPGDVELKLLMPSSKRNQQEEAAIKKRLKEYFKKHSDLAHKEVRKVIRTGVFFIILGILFMFLATFVAVKFKQSLLTNFIVILFEPGGWFFFWEGLAHLVYKSKEKTPQAEFFEKMSASKINFDSY